MSAAHVRVDQVNFLVLNPASDPPDIRRLAIKIAVDEVDAHNARFLQPAVFAAQNRHFMTTRCKHF